MRGVTKCIALTLLVLSVIYLITRISALVSLYQTQGQGTMIGRNSIKFSNIELVHFFTIAHSITCVGIATFVYMNLRKNQTIDRRQYYFVLGLTTLVTVLYFFALMFVVYKTTYATA
jgi:hypothetical protein